MPRDVYAASDDSACGLGPVPLASRGEAILFPSRTRRRALLRTNEKRRLSVPHERRLRHCASRCRAQLEPGLEDRGTKYEELTADYADYTDLIRAIRVIRGLLVKRPDGEIQKFNRTPSCIRRASYADVNPKG